MKSTEGYLRAPLFWWLAGLIVMYAFTAVLTEAPALLLVQNATLSALALGVVIAYAPPAFAALRSSKPRQGELLTLGIFLAWTATFLLRVMGTLRYGLDRPEMYGTDYSTWSTFVMALAAICHLAAPEAIDGWAPRRTWVQAGAWISAGLVVLALLILYRTHSLDIF
jgi:hypothetical protein